MWCCCTNVQQDDDDQRLVCHNDVQIVQAAHTDSSGLSPGSRTTSEVSTDGGSSTSDVLASFRPFDDRLAAALGTGAILLLDAAKLRAGGLHALACRQQLEARDEAALFLPPAAAATALRAADRRVCFVSHAWRTIVHPDPDGETFGALLRFLRDPLGAHIVGVFVDFACLHQWPRTAEQNIAYRDALKVIGNAYASPLGTMVARCESVPPCPANLAAVSTPPHAVTF